MIGQMDDQRQAADAAACAAAPDRPAPDAKANQLAKLKKATDQLDACFGLPTET